MSTTASNENAETVSTYEHDGETFEVDHLGIGHPDTQMGLYQVYRDGQTVAEFSAGVALSLCSVQFADEPADDGHLIVMAKEAVAELAG